MLWLLNGPHHGVFVAVGVNPTGPGSFCVASSSSCKLPWLVDYVRYTDSVMACQSLMKTSMLCERETRYTIQSLNHLRNVCTTIMVIIRGLVTPPTGYGRRSLMRSCLSRWARKVLAPHPRLRSSSCSRRPSRTMERSPLSGSRPFPRYADAHDTVAPLPEYGSRSFQKWLTHDGVNC